MYPTPGGLLDTSMPRDQQCIQAVFKCRYVVIERARVRQLVWGSERDTMNVRTLRPEGFDIVIGSDVAYVEEAMPALLRTVSSHLSYAPQVKPT